MTKPVLFVGILVAVLGAAVVTRVSGQEYTTASVVCAPCDGSQFGIAAGSGMVLMRGTSGSADLWFYPLDKGTAVPVTFRGFPPTTGMQTVPIRIGGTGSIGAPFVWADNK